MTCNNTIIMHVMQVAEFLVGGGGGGGGGVEGRPIYVSGLKESWSILVYRFVSVNHRGSSRH